MNIDSEIHAALQPPRSDGTYFSLDIFTARAVLDDMVRKAADALPSIDEVSFSDFSIGAIGVRLYRPLTGSETSLPLLVLAHGGGWVAGSIASHDRFFAQIAKLTGCCVASIDYRLAPEAKFPAALDDVIAVFRHIQAEGHQLNIDLNRIAIGGDSAGGTLAAALSIMTRDAGCPPPLFQLLLYPPTDLAGTYPSRAEFAGGPMFSGKELEWYIDSYLPDRSLATDFRASPLHANDLSGLPPAIIVTAGNDMLRDEGVAFAAALISAGNQVIHSHYPTMVHGFLMFADISNEASKALTHICMSIRSAFEMDIGS